LSILTKICVVVLLVLILFACPVFITQATVAPNWRHAYNQKKSEALGYMMDAKAEKLAHNKTIEQRDQAIDALERFKEEKKLDLSKVMSDLSTARSNVATLHNNLSVLAAKVGGLEREAANFNQRNDLLSAQLAEARESIDKLTKEVIRVTEALKQTQAEKARLAQQARVFQGRIRELEEENEQLLRGGVARLETEEIPVVAAEEITGTIEAVRGGYASINIGSAKGVKPNMKLTIYRGSKLVGFLRIDQVELDEAAGIVIDPQLDVMQGDKVTNKLVR